MPPPNQIAGRVSLDFAVEAFEEAIAVDRVVDLASFLPEPTDPDYLAILCELVRVDMEYSWLRDEPKRLGVYEARFPQLFEEPQRAREVAFEEFRLRQQAGESPSPDEYRGRFGGNPADWPLAGIAPGTDPTESRSGRPHGARGGMRPRQSTLASKTWKKTQERACALSELRRFDPPAADRLTGALDLLPEVGDRFLGFDLKRELGRGAFGRVFLAEQEQMAGRPVALKITADALCESHALAQLQHTNVVPIYSMHRDGPLQAVCMPFLGSTTLEDVIAGLDGGRSLPDSGRRLLGTLDERRDRSSVAPPSVPVTLDDPPGDPDGKAPAGPPPSPQLEQLCRSNYVDAILWLAQRLADGLAHAHERGILHRDLKPANVLFTDGGEPMLLDFNLAADLKLSVEGRAAMVGGTLPYMAPEHLEAFEGMTREVDSRSDIFSLGVILFELLTGRPPFEPRRGPLKGMLPRLIADRKGPAPRLRDKNRAVSPAVEAIVRRCLEPDPARRYQKARHLVEDLERQGRNLPLTHVREPSVRERMAKFARRHPRITSTTTVAIVSLAIIAVLLGTLQARQSRVRGYEAREAMARLGADVREAEYLLASPDVDPRKIEEGLRLCRTAAGRFGVGDAPGLLTGPLVSPLGPAERAELSQQLVEILGLWARGECWRAEALTPTDQADRLARATRLLDRAEATLRPAEAPAVLLEIRADLARLQGRPEDSERFQAASRRAAMPTARERLLLIPDRLARGRYRDALSLAEDASRDAPTDSSPWLIRGFCLAKLGRFSAAEDCYDVGIGLRPGFDWAYFDRAMIALENRDHARAIEDFERVLALNPRRWEARLNLALARLATGDATGALADLDHVLARPEAPTRAWFIRARADDTLGLADRALADRREGLRRLPGDELSWVTRGLNRLPDDPAGAVADFDAALRLNPRSSWALQNKASVLSESLHRTEQAVQTLDTALALEPESVPALTGRGVLLGRLGRRDDALRDATASLAQDDSADTQYRVACIYALTSKVHPGDASEALKLLASAIRRDPAWLAQVSTDPDLAPLGHRPDFRQLMEALAVVTGAASR